MGSSNRRLWGALTCWGITAKVVHGVINGAGLRLLRAPLDRSWGGGSAQAVTGGDAHAGGSKGPVLERNYEQFWEMPLAQPGPPISVPHLLPQTGHLAG